MRCLCPSEREVIHRESIHSYCGLCSVQIQQVTAENAHSFNTDWRNVSLGQTHVHAASVCNAYLWFYIQVFKCFKRIYTWKSKCVELLLCRGFFSPGWTYLSSWCERVNRPDFDDPDIFLCTSKQALHKLWGATEVKLNSKPQLNLLISKLVGTASISCRILYKALLFQLLSPDTSTKAPPFHAVYNLVNDISVVRVRVTFALRLRRVSGFFKHSFSLCNVLPPGRRLSFSQLIDNKRDWSGSDQHVKCNKMTFVVNWHFFFK